MGGLASEGGDVGSSITVSSPRSGGSSTFSRLSKCEGSEFCEDIDPVRALLALDSEWGLSSGLLGLVFSGLYEDTRGLGTCITSS